jgi:two-component SAPR family response regulator
MTGLSLRGVRILIVEDNYVVADALKYLIDGYDGSVTAIVPSVERAMTALADGGVDIAVLDINLHGASVVPVAERLRADGVPFVFLTGYGDGELLPPHLRDLPRLDKPVDGERLVRAMLELIGPRG